MKHPSVLVSEGQILTFRTQGYVCLRDFFPYDAVDKLREISDAMSSQAASILGSCQTARVSLADHARHRPLELIVVPEESSAGQVCRYEFMITSDSSFRMFVENYVEPIVTELVGESVVPFKDKTNEKLPGGGAFRPHQDFVAYRGFKPRFHATVLLSIDPANSNNGCLQFATNLLDLIQAWPDYVLEYVDSRALLHYNSGGTYNGDIRADITDKLSWERLETSPADLVVFDSFIPHHSEANRSASPRRAVFVTFNRAAEGSFYEEYYADKRKNYDDPKFHVSTPTVHRRSARAGGP